MDQKDIADIKSFLLQIQELTKRSFDKVPASINTLSKFGWFIDWSYTISQLNDLAELIEKDKLKAENLLSEEVRLKIPFIKERLTDRYRHRTKIFEQLFNSFTNKQYFLTIPILFSQIDGICFDVTKKKYFITTGKKGKHLPQIEAELSKSSDKLVDLFLMQIKTKNVINSHSNDLSSYPIVFNRHLIMHGVDFAYGTELNCLKTFSLINFIDNVLEDFEGTIYQSSKKA